MNLGIPAASDPTEFFADWIECEALRSANGSVSLSDITKLVRMTGSTDALEGVRGDAGSVISQAVAEDAFAEIENRRVACGPANYPFELKRGVIRAKPNAETSPYILLLLMSATRPTAGHSGTAVLFEQICTAATIGYLGGSKNAATATRFGSPRRAPIAKLGQAIDQLCASLSEGGGCRRPAKAKHLGDGGLDIVGWRSFPDAREGKLVAFGQCAAGSSGWERKLAELDTLAFMKKWFRTLTIVEPVRLFFVPRRLPKQHWEDAGIDGGILFDRCRIVACLDEETSPHRTKQITTARQLLKQLRSTLPRKRLTKPNR